MKKVTNNKTGEIKWINDIIYINGTEPMEYVTAHSAGITNEKGQYMGYSMIFEKPEGNGFVFADGTPIKLETISLLPPGMKERAEEWFNKTYCTSQAPIPEVKDGDQAMSSL